VFIDGLLGEDKRSLGRDPGFEHVGEEHAAKLRIDGSGERE
jgi:hypothetical protein